MFLLNINLVSLRFSFYPLLKSFRQISLTSVNNVKEIIITTKDNITTVEGNIIESDRKDSLIKRSKKICPLCKLNLKNLEFHDVLILQQFVDEEGKMLSQEDSQLCSTQYNLVSNLVEKAQICNLLPRPKDYIVYGPWDTLNTYYEFPERKRDQPMEKVEPYYWR